MGRSYVRGNDGEVKAIRETSNDGRRSYLYEADKSVVGQLFHDGKGQCTEVADHHPDGTTTAYKADTSFFGLLFHDGKGEEK
jgi:hypothetical protein